MRGVPTGASEAAQSVARQGKRRRTPGLGGSDGGCVSVALAL